MSEEIQLREQIIYATHRWPILVVFCLAGVFLGWGISWIYPSSIRATLELYVGLNIENYNPEAHYRPQLVNADDYKNWQMANLNTMVDMDEIIDETLKQLRIIDPYWNGIDRRELRKTLHVYWRNAGKWRLVAEGNDRLHTAQAVTIWQNTIINRAYQAKIAAESIMALDKQIEGLAQSVAHISARRAELNYLLQTIDSRSIPLKNLDPNQKLSENDRWSIWQPVAQADLGTAWVYLSKEYPSSDATVQDYLQWIARAKASLEEEISAIGAQIEQLEKDRNDLIELFSQTSNESLGLSANLELEKITTDTPQFNVIRPTSSLILIGMALGFITWVGYWLVFFSLSTHK